MDKKVLMLNVSGGVLRGVIVTTILLVIYSIVMNFVDVTPKITSMVYMVTTCLSILVGGVYASKVNGEKGWLTGLLVGAVYMGILIVVTALVNRGVEFSLLILTQLVVALGVGTLAGMLGINL